MRYFALSSTRVLSIIDIVAVPEQHGKRNPQSRQVFSDVHKGRPCTSCILCKEKTLQYTHPIKWKNAALLKFLQVIEPNLNIPPDACICRNCRDSLSSGHKNADIMGYDLHPNTIS